MKLYAAPYGTNIRLQDEEGNTLDLKFHYLDGAYGYCTDKNGNPQHIALWADVEITDGEAA